MDYRSAMKARKSTRTFREDPLSERDSILITDLVSSAGHDTPWGSDFSFGFVKLENGVVAGTGDTIGTYGVIKNQQGYIYGVTPRTEQGVMDFSYAFQRIVIELTRCGIDSVWLGGTFSRKGILREAVVPAGHYVPAITPLGYAAEKRRFSERLARKITRTTSRKECSQLFFEKDFRTPLVMSELDDLGEAFEMVRIAPSAMNAQSWRLVRDGNTIHFYNELTRKNYNRDMMRWYQMLDMGIAMYHFDAAVTEKGNGGSFVKRDPLIETPTPYCTYFATYVLV